MARQKRRTLASLFAAAALLGVAYSVRSDDAQAQVGPHRFALTGVNIVDVRSGKVFAGRTVVIAGNRITAVQNASAALDSDVKVVPATGKFLMPGLWDMHVHVADEGYLDLFVANGITGVRDMGGGRDRPADGCESLIPSILRRWRSEVTAGRRIGPEIVFSGPAVSGTGAPTSLPARSEDEARAAVRTLKRLRVDFIKVYERIPLAAYLVLAAEAKQSRLPFAGHVPEEVGVLAAIGAGQRSIEHIRDALLVCFTDSPSDLEQFFNQDHWGEDDKKWGRAAHQSCSDIIARLRGGDVWLTPTLTVEKAKVAVEDPGYVTDDRRRFLPDSVRSAFSIYVKQKLAQSPSDRASERLWWRTQQAFVKRASREGVKLLAGTDAACQGGLPGYSLHGELKEMVAAGLSPADALRAATIEPARFLSRKSEGEVVAGYRANLLILNANPLRRIENSQAIHGVIVDGRLIGRSELDALLRKPRERR